VTKDFVSDKDYKQVLEVLMNTELESIDAKIEELKNLKIKNLYGSVSGATFNSAVGMFTQVMSHHLEDKNRVENLKNRTLGEFVEDALNFSALLTTNGMGEQKEIKIFLFIMICIMMLSLVDFIKPSYIIEFFSDTCKRNDFSVEDILRGLVFFLEVIDLKKSKVFTKFLH